jgi:DNA polymerase/3'-5' exonuclease PolX
MPSETFNLSNAEIADRLAGLAQLLSTQKENPCKIKAYQRAAAKIRTLSEIVEELVHQDSDLTGYPGIGEAISHAAQDIVRTGMPGKLETLCSQAAPELAGMSNYPWLDPKRVSLAYETLGISSGVTETHPMLLYGSHELRQAVEEAVSF